MKDELLAYLDASKNVLAKWYADITNPFRKKKDAFDESEAFRFYTISFTVTFSTLEKWIRGCEKKEQLMVAENIIEDFISARRFPDKSEVELIIAKRYLFKSIRQVESNLKKVA